MKKALEEIRAHVIAELEKIYTEEDIEKLRLYALGKKGKLTEILRGMGQLPASERPAAGQHVNELRNELEEKFSKHFEIVRNKMQQAKLVSETVDITMPGKKPVTGSFHPLTQTENTLVDIFLNMGFDVVDGPEVETDYYNFEALNVPADHPARDMNDTFFLSPQLLLRSQTSGVQIRTMEDRKPPIRVVCPGRVYRADEVDATHSPIFHQLEGLVVDKGINMCHLKHTLEEFAHVIYGEASKVRFRPSFFPFTEPSVEVDVSCSACGGEGCRVCKGSGWIEILGAGMVHPNVLRNCGIDPDVYSGFAFGIGIDRMTMTRHKISDIRLLFENDVRFLEQFS